MSKRFLLAVTSCFLAPLLLVGCNGGEDFSDADIGGHVIQPSPGGGGPLGDDVDTVRVEFIDDRVENLGYECRGDSGSGYIGRRQIQEGGEPKQVDYPEDDENAHLPLVAECGIDSTRVDFFIGDVAQQDRRIHLGRFYLPQNVQQPRLQVSPADIVQSPARVLAQVEDDQGSPMPLANRQAFYIASLLQALDNENDNSIIQVPDAAHALVLNCCGAEEDEPAPENLWDYDNYSGFKNEWQPWLDAVDDLGGASSSFPNQQEVSEALYAPENETPSYASIDRMRAGSFQFVSAPYTRKFIEDGEGAALVPPMVLQLPVLVHPDGRVQGMGFAADVSNNEDDEAELSASTLIAVDEGARLDGRMQMTSDQGEGWSVSHLFTEESDPEVDLNLSGRILGITLYYALDGPPGSSPNSSDFDRDYPQNDVYSPDSDEEGGRYDGTAFGNQDFDNQLLQGSRQGIVGIDIDKTLSGPGDGLHFYELTPWKACRDGDSGGCSDLPNGESAGDNYSESVQIEETTFTVSREKRKPSIQDDHPGGVGNPDQSFNVEIRDDGYIVTDLDKDRCPTIYNQSEDAYYEQGANNSEDHREYRVGFVTRTHSDDSPQSVNITVHMTGPPHLRDDLPHYGLRTNGRINPSDGPLYRTGDVNFEDGIRARWLDQASGSGYAYRLYERSVGSDLTPEQKFERLSRLQGALEGEKLSTNSTNCPQP